MTITEITDRNVKLIELYKKGITPTMLARKLNKDNSWFYKNVLGSLEASVKHSAVAEHKSNRSNPKIEELTNF